MESFSNLQKSSSKTKSRNVLWNNIDSNSAVYSAGSVAVFVDNAPLRILVISVNLCIISLLYNTPVCL